MQFKLLTLQARVSLYRALGGGWKTVADARPNVL